MSTTVIKLSKENICRLYSINYLMETHVDFSQKMSRRKHMSIIVNRLFKQIICRLEKDYLKETYVHYSQ